MRLPISLRLCFLYISYILFLRLFLFCVWSFKTSALLERAFGIVLPCSQWALGKPELSSGAKCGPRVCTNKQGELRLLDVCVCVCVCE